MSFHRLTALALLAVLPIPAFSTDATAPERASAENVTVPGSTAVRGSYVEARLQGRELIRRLPNIRKAGIEVAGRSQTIISWHIAEGVWDGQKLDGLSLALVIDSKRAPLAPQDKPPTVRSTAFIDERASEKQEEALLSLATELAPEPLRALRKLRRTTIVWHGSPEEEHGLVDDHATPIEEEDHDETGASRPIGTRVLIGKLIRLRAYESEHLHSREGDHSLCAAAPCGGGNENKVQALSRHAKAERAAPVGNFWVDSDSKVADGYRISDEKTIALGKFEL